MTIKDKAKLALTGLALTGLALGALGACATLQPIADRLAKAEAECKAAGGAYMLDKGCVMPEEPHSPAPPPTPEEPPPPPVEPPPEEPTPNGPGRKFGPYSEHQFYTVGHSNAPGGKIMFWIGGLAAINAPHDTEGFIFMAMGRHRTGEMNLQMMVNYNTVRRQVEIRLTTQRFNDPGCVRLGARWCEAADYIDSTQEPGLDFNPFVRYLVTIEWDARSARMLITPEGGRIYTWAGPNGNGIPTWGGFVSYDYIRIGNGVFTGKPGYQCEIVITDPAYEARP